MTDRAATGGALDALTTRLGVADLDAGLLAHALRHRSWCAENPVAPSNERLEFLGDAVLGLVVTDHLYTTYPQLSEGELAKVRAAVVSATALAEVARRLELGSALALGRGEEASGGRGKSSILADAVEAVFGAIYLSGGIEAARHLILDLLADPLAAAVRSPGDDDFKTRLQELAARAADEVPRYTVDDEGPDHAKLFSATVEVGLGSDRVVRGIGEGRSKKQAEQAAAREAWQALVDALEADDESAAADPLVDRRSHA